jgi:hypothetical protein
MLRFWSTGVELPNAVQRALEDERLVLFCGAGISVYTGLPNFSELTHQLFADCAVPLEDEKPEGIAFRDKKFDRALALLERASGRATVRRMLSKRLTTPPLAQESECALHRYLLDLTALSNGGHRLVTTNFDDRFHLAAAAARQLHPNLKAYDLTDIWDAPRVATPRKENWHSLTFLHGRITQPQDSSVENLILTSADFGRAYLQDGWAARFVVELFREFTVLFVGYSIDDPVMGYLVDAIALDRDSGKPFFQPYVFAAYDVGADIEPVKSQWQSKNVEPILYPAENNHIALRYTLEEWAKRHRLGFDGRLAKALEITSSPHMPVGGKDQEEIDNLVWALSQADGSVARAFADNDPAPDISWLQPLLNWSNAAAEQRRTLRNDTRSREKAQPQNSNEHGAFLVDGYWLGDPLAPPVIRDPLGEHIRRTPVFEIERPEQPHPVAYHLARWIVRHLDKPELARIVAARNGRIGRLLCERITEALGRRKEPPPGDLGKFWRIVVEAHEADHHERDQFWRGEWLARELASGELAYDTRAHLLTPFKPHVDIRPSWQMLEMVIESQGKSADATMPKLKSLANLDITLLANKLDLHRRLAWLRKAEHKPILTELAVDLGECLANILRYAEWIEDASPLRYHYIRLKSLHDAHERHSNDWRILVELCRDSLDALTKRDAAAASALIERWGGYSRQPWGELFIRLILHACTQHSQTPEVAIQLLLGNVNDALWNYSFSAELFPFLRSLAKRVPQKTVRALDRALRVGPLTDHWSRRDKRSLQRTIADERLMCLYEGGSLLTRIAKQRAQRLTDARQTAGHAVPEDEAVSRAHAVFVASPDATLLLTLAPEQAATSIAAMNDWNAGKTLKDFARKEPIRALEVYEAIRGNHNNAVNDLLEWLISGAGELKVAEVFIDVGPRFLRYLDPTNGIKHSFWGYCDWLNTAATVLTVEQEESSGFWSIWDRVWLASVTGQQNESGDDDHVTEALNSRGGKLCQAFLDRLWKRSLPDDTGFPAELSERLEWFVSGDTEAQLNARCILASRLIWLYRIDRGWCDQHILRRMGNFGGPDCDAAVLWQGFLWPGKVSARLWPALKPALLRALQYTARIDTEYADRIVEFFAVNWLRPGAFGAEDKESLRTIFGRFEAAQLVQIASSFSDALRAHGNSAPALWREQIGPYIMDFWPLRLAAQSPMLNSEFSEMMFHTREAFPDALHLLMTEKQVLGPAKDLSALYRLTHELDAGETATFYYMRFPLEMLQLLDKLVDRNVTESWHNRMLKNILDQIEYIRPDLATSDEMQRLREFLRIG